MRSRIRKTDFEGVFGNVAAINDSHTIIAFAKPLAKLLKEYGVRTEGPKRLVTLRKYWQRGWQGVVRASDAPSPGCAVVRLRPVDGETDWVMVWVMD